MTKTYSTASNARRAAKAAGIPADAVEVTEVNGAFTFADKRAGLMMSVEDEDLGVVRADSAEAEAQAYANQHQVTVYLRDTTTDEVVKVVKPARKMGGRVKKLAEVLPEVATTQQPKAEAAPSGMVAKIIDLAVREQGVTPAELNALTNWKGAPWKWLMQNPKKTGYADRWGYTLHTVKTGRAVAYKLVKNA